MSNTTALMFNGHRDRRGADRRVVDLEATLRAGDRPSDALVHELSASGCCVETDVRLQPGTRVSIGMSGLGVHDAIVMRAITSRLSGGTYGCRFEARLDEMSLRDADAGANVLALGFGRARRPLSRPAYLAIGLAILAIPVVAGWAGLAYLIWR